MIEKKSPLAATVPAVKELRKVSGFNPLNLLRSTVSPNGEKVLKLDLRYKRLWFRLACPNGRMVLNPLRITDQMAIFEASLYADKTDTAPLATFTSTQWANSASDKQYVRTAQDAALNEVLDNAGFGIQLCDIAQVSDGSGFGSEIPLSQVKAIKQDATPVENPTVEMPKQNTAPVENSTLAQAKAEESTEGTKTSSVIQEAELPPQNETLTADPPQEQPNTDAFIEAKPDAAEEMLPASETQCSYTEDMTVEEICERMTLEEAKSIVVPTGICKDWTLGQVYEERRSSLKWYMTGCPNASNILKAGARILLNASRMQKAG